MDNRDFQLITLCCLFLLFTGVLFGFFQSHKQPAKEEDGAASNFQAEVASSSVEFNEPKEAKIILTGDVMLGRTVTTKSIEEENDPRYPFLEVAEELRNADLTFINLENPIVENCPRHTTGFKFCAPPEMIEGLVYAGVDVVTLANNHSRNYGEEGFQETIEVLSNRGIEAVGNGNLAVKVINDIRFGFLGFDFLENAPQEADYLLVKNSDEIVEVLVVGVHWGAEYQPEAGERQEQWARELVSSGADVVVGHHPHWIQNIEYINEKPVYYSLGNFIFDQMWSEKTREGMVVRLTFKGTTLQGEEFLPIFMNEWAKPEWVE